MVRNGRGLKAMRKYAILSFSPRRSHSSKAIAAQIERHDRKIARRSHPLADDLCLVWLQHQLVGAKRPATARQNSRACSTLLAKLIVISRGSRCAYAQWVQNWRHCRRNAIVSKLMRTHSS